MKRILAAMSKNLDQMKDEHLDSETRSFLASTQVKLAEAFIQSLHAEESQKFNQKSHSNN